MTANYHAHTTRCHHATGEEREYIENGISNGIELFGFSDHTPQIFPEGYYSNFRMHPNEVEGYFDTILKLKAEYADKIEIKIGFEVEYYPEIFDKLMDYVAKYRPDYFVLGQHFIDNEYDTHRPSGTVKDEAGFIKYVDQTIQAMSTGCFSIFAHPDLIEYNENAEVYEREMTRLCEYAKEYDVPLEFNLLGYSEKRHYPNIEFWKIAAKIGNDVVLGCDAHSPDRVGKHSEIESAEKLLSGIGITPKDRIELKDPCKK